MMPLITLHGLMGKKSMPKVSVVMPAYNAEVYIRKAIDSILSQTFTDFEFIIIDDGSTDATAEIVQHYKDGRIKFCSNKQNIGVAATLNHGLELSCGEYIARMDADDISLPERFEKQVAYLDEHQDVAVLGTDIELFSDSGILEKRVVSHESDKIKEELFFSCSLAHPSVMMRRNMIADLGGYDIEYNGMEDYELWIRVAEKHKISALSEILLRYRIHGGQVSKNPSSQFMEKMRRLKKRQASRLSVTATEQEIDLFSAYCTMTLFKSLNNTLALNDFFEKVAEQNAKEVYYCQKYLIDDLSAVMLALIMELPSNGQNQLCAKSRFVSIGQLRIAKMKLLAKRMLGMK